VFEQAFHDSRLVHEGCGARAGKPVIGWMNRFFLPIFGLEFIGEIELKVLLGRRSRGPRRGDG
jgi:hypothetical protein